ncbi:hypothetical protein cypCar_00049370 [Cyprinus carpio]|nr:hypothetical protein cypCar_00049370 [Cyprinus carpio]
MRSALSEEFTTLRANINAARAEIASNATAIRAEIASIETDIEDVKGGLSSWSDEGSADWKDVKIDRSHRAFAPKKPRDTERPRVIIAKLHYDGDAADILRRAKDQSPLIYNGKRIAIFPDYTTSVAKARAAFTDARKALRGRRDVRFGLLYPARFKITYKEDSKEFSDAVKAMDYIKKTILATTTETET